MTEVTDNFTIEAQEYVEEQGTVLKKGVYPAVLTGFGHFESQFGERLVWQFEVDGGKKGKVEAAAFTSYSMATGKKESNLIRYAKALSGGELPAGLKRDDLVGKSCEVLLDSYTKSSNGITKNKVADVMVADAEDEEEFEDIQM